MSNGQKSVGEVAVNVFSGIGLGLLLGVIVGLSKSPVVAIVVGGLTSLLAVFLGLESGEDSRIAALAKIQLNGLRIGSFGLATVCGLLLGLYVRINNPLAEPLDEHLDRWTDVFPDNLVLAQQMMIFERSGIKPKAMTFGSASGGKGADGTVTVAVETDTDKASASEAWLFNTRKAKKLCGDLRPDRYIRNPEEPKAYLEAFADEKDPLLNAVILEVQKLPKSHQSGALTAVHTLLCALEKQEASK